MIDFNKYSVRRVWNLVIYEEKKFSEIDVYGGFEIYRTENGSLCFKEREKYLEKSKTFKYEEITKNKKGLRFLWFISKEELRLFRKEHGKDFYSAEKIKEMLKNKKIGKLCNNDVDLPSNIVFKVGEENND
jgi:hypothetical protein